MFAKTKGKWREFASKIAFRIYGSFLVVHLAQTKSCMQYLFFGFLDANARTVSYLVPKAINSSSFLFRRTFPVLLVKIRDGFRNLIENRTMSHCNERLREGNRENKIKLPGHTKNFVDILCHVHSALTCHMSRVKSQNGYQKKTDAKLKIENANNENGERFVSTLSMAKCTPFI